MAALKPSIWRRSIRGGSAEHDARVEAVALEERAGPSDELARALERRDTNVGSEASDGGDDDDAHIRFDDRERRGRKQDRRERQKQLGDEAVEGRSHGARETGREHALNLQLTPGLA